MSKSEIQAKGFELMSKSETQAKGFELMSESETQKCSESSSSSSMEVIPHDQPAATTNSISNSNMVGCSIPYFPHERKNYHYGYEPYPSPTKRNAALRLKKLYSIRARGHSRSGPLHSLARKLGRFKVRSVLVQETTTTK